MRLAQHTAKIVGSPFSLGGRSTNDGFDCVTLIVDHLIQCGQPISFNDHFRGESLEVLTKRFETDPATFEIAIDYIQEILTEIDPCRSVAGDVLLLKLNKSDHPHFFAIDGGNGKAVTVTEKKGVINIPKHYYIMERAFKAWPV